MSVSKRNLIQFLSVCCCYWQEAGETARSAVLFCSPRDPQLFGHKPSLHLKGNYLPIVWTKATHTRPCRLLTPHLSSHTHSCLLLYKSSTLYLIYFCLVVYLCYEARFKLRTSLCRKQSSHSVVGTAPKHCFEVRVLLL